MKKNQKGFTLMELMVVIVIVAILAAVAVPLYINYVKDAQLTEAKGAIGAIISGEQAYYQRSVREGGTATYGKFVDLVGQKLVDVSEARVRWEFTTSDETETGYKITATYKSNDPKPPTITYEFKRPDLNGAGGIAKFSDE